MKETQQSLFDGFDIEPPQEQYPAAFLSRPEKALRLCSVKIEALKGINELSIDLQPHLTILTGPNNSGKSTILQAILLGFDAFRRCIDVSSWKIKTSGRAVSELDFLRVNHPKDLWFKQKWKASKNRERYIKVGFTFDNEFHFVARIRFLYGALNIGIEIDEKEPSEEIIKSIASSAPILIPPSGGPQAHELSVSLAQLHNTLNTGDPARVLRNILFHLQNDINNESWEFVKHVIKRYFGQELEKIKFDEKFDLDIRAPYSEFDYSLDIISAGSGLNQILQLAAILAWRKPGIVLLDEPDAHLHSSLQSKMLDFLYELTHQYDIQIILSTHSRDIISQAPLQTIIPVDLSRSHLKPIASLEHLLLEFERQGTVSNVDIALLYQTKKCLFTEGITESKLLPKIAEQLDVHTFSGKEQVVTFEFDGIENLKLIPKVVSLFERIIGAKLSWAILRDRDANLPEVIEEYRKKSEILGIENLFIWSCYSIENLLLDPKLIEMALSKKYTNNCLTIEHIQNLLKQAIEKITTDVVSIFITKAQTAYKFLGKDNPFDKGAKDAYSFISSLTTLESKLKYFPGKRIYGQFVQLLQDNNGFTLRLEDIITVINKDNSPKDFLSLFKILENI